MIAFTSTLRAADEPNASIVAVGRVNRAAQNGSMTGTAVAAPATSNAAATLGNTAPLTNQFMLNGATPPEATNAALAKAISGQPTNALETSYVLNVARSETNRTSATALKSPAHCSRSAIRRRHRRLPRESQIAACSTFR